VNGWQESRQTQEVATWTTKSNRWKTKNRENWQKIDHQHKSSSIATAATIVLLLSLICSSRSFPFHS
jgi:hypothetical protein